MVSGNGKVFGGVSCVSGVLSGRGAVLSGRMCCVTGYHPDTATWQNAGHSVVGPDARSQDGERNIEANTESIHMLSVLAAMFPKAA